MRGRRYTMNAPKLYLLASLAAVIAAAALWVRLDGGGARAPPEAAPATSRPEQATPLSAERSPPAIPAPPAAPAAVEPGPPSAAARAVSLRPDSDPRAELIREMADSAYRAQGHLYVDYLVSRGLARLDSEQVIVRGFHDAAACSFAAMRAQADAQSVDPDTLLYAIEAMLQNADGPEITALIDLQAVRAREMPCMLNVMQQAGIPPQVAQRIRRASRGR